MTLVSRKIAGPSSLATLLLSALALSTACSAAPQASQKQGGYSSSKSNAGDSSSSSSSSSSSAASSDQANGAPAYDPFHAQQDVEIGTYYMRKGDPDAAIGRFEDAIRMQANFVKPRLLLAEAYLKKGNKSQAVKYYKQYLQVYPSAPDAGKIRGKIEKLSK